MKLYILSHSDNGLRKDGDDYYHLVSEEGELIGTHISSSRDWAKIDLYDNNKMAQELCKEKFGDDIEIVFLGDDHMTELELIKLNGKFNHS